MELSPRQKALIGALICIGANTLISLALNVQKLAHVRLQQGLEGSSEGDAEDADEHHGRGSSLDEAREEGVQDDEGEGGDEDEQDNTHGPTTEFLRSRLWWTGMGLMVLGEGGNFVCECRRARRLPVVHRTSY